jgi:hypothetical protein
MLLGTCEDEDAIRLDWRTSIFEKGRYDQTTEDVKTRCSSIKNETRVRVWLRAILERLVA